MVRKPGAKNWQFDSCMIEGWSFSCIFPCLRVKLARDISLLEWYYVFVAALIVSKRNRCCLKEPTFNKVFTKSKT